MHITAMYVARSVTDARKCKKDGYVRKPWTVPTRVSSWGIGATAENVRTMHLAPIQGQ